MYLHTYFGGHETFHWFSFADTFQCQEGFSLPISLKCDGIDNCGDNSDEEKCSDSSNTTQSTTTTAKFTTGKAWITEPLNSEHSQFSELSSAEYNFI